MYFRRHIPLLIALLANGLLWLILTELNHHLACLSLTILIPAAFVLYAGLNLRFAAGMTACLLAGFLQDAALPFSPHGFFTLTLPTLHLAFYRLRGKLHREGGLDTVLLAQILNLVTILVLAIYLGRGLNGGITRHLPALLLQTLLAQVLLFCIGGYFLETQRRLAKYLNPEPMDEEART